MTEFNIKQFYEDQVAWYTKQVEWNNEEIEWLTKQMNMEREEFKKMREYIWSKGVLTKWEMEIWGKNECNTPDFKKYKSQRRTEYRRRKHNLARIEHYKAQLANA